MVKKIINFPYLYVFKFLTWLNRNSTSLLVEEKIKFNQLVEKAGDTCLFFGDWPEDTVEKSDVQKKHDDFGERANLKTSRRVSVARVLEWAILIIFSGMLTKVPTMEISDLFQTILAVTGFFMGLVITKIQKSILITIRLDAYK